MADDGKTEVLYYSEVESYIENLQRFPLNEIGTLKYVMTIYSDTLNQKGRFCFRWFGQHEMLEKLNLQALHEAKEHREEVVSERFQFFDKVTLGTSK